MLILSRKLNESIIVRHRGTGEVIATVTVAGMPDGQVKLGFDAGLEIEILRSELLDRYPRGSHEQKS